MASPPRRFTLEELQGAPPRQFTLEELQGAGGIENDPEFHSLLTLKSQLQRAQGSDLRERNNLLAQIYSIQEALSKRHKVPIEEIDRLVLGRGPAIDPTPPLADQTVRPAPFAEQTGGVIDTGVRAAQAVGEAAKNVFMTTLGAFEFLAAPGDALRAGIGVSLEERAKREPIQPRPGESPLATWWRGRVQEDEIEAATFRRVATEMDWLSYVPWGRPPTGGPVRGEDLLDLTGIGERLGLQDDSTAKQLAGIAVEIFTDPLLAATWVGAGAKAVGAAGRVARSDRLLKTSQNLASAGRQLEYMTSPAGAVGGAKTVARLIAGDTRVQAAQRTVNRFVDAILDAEIPMPARKFQEPVGPEFGFRVDEQGLPVRLRDMLFKGGRAPVGENIFRPGWLVGSPTDGPAAMQIARGEAQPVARYTAEGIENINNIILDGLGVQRARVDLPGIRVRLFNQRVVPEKHRGFVQGFHELSWNFVDSVGTTRITEGYTEYLPRVQRLAKTYGVDEELAATMFRQTTDAARVAAIKTGYVISGYDEFATAMEKAARNLDLDYLTHRKMLEMEAAGVDIAELMQTGVLPAGRGRVPAAWMRPEARENFKRFKEETSRLFSEMGGPTIHPATFLGGVRDGYLRRIFSTKDYNPVFLESLIDRVTTGSLALLAEIDIPAIVARVKTRYGDNAAQAVDNYLSSRPGGGGIGHALRVDDLSDLIGRHSDVSVNPEALTRIIHGGERNYKLIEETTDRLRESLKLREYRPWEARQELDEKKITALVAAADPALALARTATAGMESVAARRFLQMAADNLKEGGMLRTIDDLPTLVDPNDRAKMTHLQRAFQGLDHEGKKMQLPPVTPFTGQDGVRYVVIPKRSRAWGPLAGSIMPHEMATQVLRNLQKGPNQRASGFERVLSMYRRGMIAPLDTSLRNIVGSVLLQHLAGGDMFDILAKLPRAHKLRQTYYRTGRLPGFEGNERLLPWLNDDRTTLARELSAPAAERLERLAGAKTPEGLISRLENLTEVVTTTPALGGFMNFFKWGEETTRMASFLSTHDGLIARGMAADEAVRRAAHFALNATYDYGSLPKLADILRRTGLAVFPQFAMYTVGRLAEAAYRRPGKIMGIERGRQAVSAAGVSREEQEAVTALMPDYLRGTTPLILPVGDQRGHFSVINLEFLLPQAAHVGPTFIEPLLGGAARPLLELFAAIVSGDGEAFFSKQFGQQVFSTLPDIDRAIEEASLKGDMKEVDRLLEVRQQGIPITQNVLEATNFFLRNYVFVGQQRMFRRIAETIRYNTDAETMEDLGEMTARHFDLSWPHLFAGMLGVRARTVDTVPGGRSYMRRLRQLEAAHRAGRITDAQYLAEVEKIMRAVR